MNDQIFDSPDEPEADSTSEPGTSETRTSEPGTSEDEMSGAGLLEENPLKEITTMILAAGLGTRVHPLSLRLPKPLLPVCGRPLLEWNLRFLARAGVEQVVLNAHHLTESIETWLEREYPPEFIVDDSDIKSPHVQIVKEPVLLGTAGGIANASPLLRSDPVLIWNVDLLFQPDLGAALEFHRASGALATLLLVRDPQFSKISLDGDMISAVAPEADPADPSLWAYTGIALLSQEAIAELPNQGFEPLPPHLRRWAAAGQLAGYRSNATFREVGTLEGYWEIHRELQGPLRPELLVGEPPTFRRQPGGFGFIAAGATVSPNSHVEESIVLAGAEILEGADVRRSILGPGARADANVEGTAAAAGESRSLALLPLGAESHLERFLAAQIDTWPKEIRRELKKTKRAPRIRRIQGDGSGRQVLRVTTGSASRIAVLDVEPPESEAATSIYPVRALLPNETRLPSSLQSFLYVHELLWTGGIRVPELLATDQENGLILLEDLGVQQLADLPRKSPDEEEKRDLAKHPHDSLKLYEEAIDILLEIQGLTPIFDPNLVQNPTFDHHFGFTYEAGYFLKQFVLGIADPDSPLEESAASQRLVEELARLSEVAMGDGKLTLIHRDFQSRNLMIRGGSLAVIDFQGARLGPATYDVASLLYDPYNKLTDEDRSHLLQRFFDRGQKDQSEREAQETALRSTALQRLLQNLGAFAYLGRTLGKPGFWEHVPVALERARSLAEIEYPSVERLLAECTSRLESLDVD